MKIKHLILTTILCLAGVGGISSFTGCTTKTTVTQGADGTYKTNTLSSLNLPALTNAIALAVPPAVNLAVSQEPQARAYLADAAVVINLVLASGSYDPNSLNAALNTLGVKEVRTPQAQAAIDAAVALYKGMYGQVVEAQLDKVTWLPPILKAIADGITEGLARPVMPPLTPR
jgi:hypothetical protein